MHNPNGSQPLRRKRKYINQMKSMSIMHFILCFFVTINNMLIFLMFNRWKRSLDMAKSLCELQSQLSNGHISYKCEDLNKKSKKESKRKRGIKKQIEDKNCVENCSDLQLYIKCQSTMSLGNFPSSKELACLDKDFLKKHCNLGYRGDRIIQLAKLVESGKLNLQKFEGGESHTLSSQEVFVKLNRIKGFGPFACANLMMCMGFYEVVPLDSETRRHLRQVRASNISSLSE